MIIVEDVSKTIQIQCSVSREPKICFLSARSHQTRLLKAQPLQKRIGKNAPGKTAWCACGADLRTQPTFTIFFLKRKERVRRIPPSIPWIVSRWRALSAALPTEQESVWVVFRFRIIKIFVIKYRCLVGKTGRKARLLLDPIGCLGRVWHWWAVRLALKVENINFEARLKKR